MTTEQLDVTLDALRARRARAAERADEIDSRHSKAVLRRRPQSVVALINKLNEMIGRRTQKPSRRRRGARVP